MSSRLVFNVKNVTASVTKLWGRAQEACGEGREKISAVASSIFDGISEKAQHLQKRVGTWIDAHDRLCFTVLGGVVGAALCGIVFCAVAILFGAVILGPLGAGVGLAVGLAALGGSLLLGAILGAVAAYSLHRYHPDFVKRFLD